VDAAPAVARWKSCGEIESFPTQLFETADVSPSVGTIAGCNYSFFFTSPRNGIEEADGSIPFSSTKSLRLFFPKTGLKRYSVQSFQAAAVEESFFPPSSTVITLRWRASARVSSPKKSYYLNYTQDFDGTDRQPHACYENDYTVTIPITGQAQLDFYVIDGDHHQVENTGQQMVPHVKTKQPYHGNFWEFTSSTSR
jgi:hypothetical protein